MAIQGHDRPADQPEADPGAADDDDERQLVQALRSGNPEACQRAFDRAYAAYRTRVASFLLRMTGRRDLAEDLFQETWLRLAARAETLADDTRLLTWLFAVARNLYRSHLRWSSLNAERLDQLAAQPTGSPANATPLEAAQAAQTRQQLERALAALPLQHREVIVLVAVEKLRPMEAAAVLGINQDALRQRLARARAQLAAALSEPARAQRSAP